MLPVGGGAGAGLPGTAQRRTQESPQHQGHLLTGLGHSARGENPRRSVVQPHGTRRAGGCGAQKGSAVTAAPGAPAYRVRPQRPRGKPAPMSVAAPRDAPGWGRGYRWCSPRHGTRPGGGRCYPGCPAPRDAPGWGRCYRWCSPTGPARVGQVLPVVQPHGARPGGAGVTGGAAPSDRPAGKSGDVDRWAAADERAGGAW